MDQLDEDEKKKLLALYKEKQLSQSSDKVDFLYKDKVDKEEYLLGKRVDARFEQENIPTKKESDVGALFDEDPLLHNERMNTQIKQREDPLTAIRRREEEARKALLMNPVKMKQLEKALKERQKGAKRWRKDSTGDELLARYMAIKGASIDLKSKKKKKLPDDDKSLLQRYLELIGKAKRKVFYSDLSDEETVPIESKDVKRSEGNKKSTHSRDNKSEQHNSTKQERQPRDQSGSSHNHRSRELNQSERSLSPPEHRRGEKRQYVSDRDGYGGKNREHDRSKERSRDERFNRRIDQSRVERQDNSRTKGARETPERQIDRRESRRQRSRSRSPPYKRKESHSRDDKHVSGRKRTTRSRSGSERHLTRHARESSSDSEVDREKDRKEHREKLARKRKSKGGSSPSSSSSGSRSKSGSSSSSSSSSGSDSNSGSRRRKDSANRSSSSPEKVKAAPRSYGLVHPKGSTMLEAKAQSDAKRASEIQKTSKSTGKEKSPSPKRHAPSNHKLTKEEKEARLREMMDNAKWRDDQRSKNVARYEEEQRKEDEDYARNAGKNDDFITPMMTKHASESSVEEQLRRNRHKIQRSAAATEKNFARK